jgi:hypothetical protein
VVADRLAVRHAFDVDEEGGLFSVMFDILDDDIEIALQPFFQPGPVLLQPAVDGCLQSAFPPSRFLYRLVFSQPANLSVRFIPPPFFVTLCKLTVSNYT